MRWFLAVLGAAFLFVTPVQASVCVTVEQIVTQAEEYGLTVGHIEGRQAASFTDEYNALPPVSHLIGNQVVFATGPNARGVFIFIFQDGCAQAMDEISHEMFRELAVKAEGRGV